MPSYHETEGKHMPDELSIHAFKLLTRVAVRMSRIPKQIRTKDDTKALENRSE